MSLCMSPFLFLAVPILLCPHLLIALFEQLIHEREVTGSVPGALEDWLLLRSLRTLSVRVLAQSASAERIVAFLASGSAPHVRRVHHPSLPTHPGHEIARKQMSGFGAVFSLETNEEWQARLLVTRLKIIRYATSLGGVESLIDWRHRWDSAVRLMQFCIRRSLIHLRRTDVAVYSSR